MAFIDLEVQPNSGAILDIGSVKDTGSVFHSRSSADFAAFLEDAEYLCGHNIIQHDLKYLQGTIKKTGLAGKAIDTLHLSALLFPRKPYHALVKNSPTGLRA